MDTRQKSRHHCHICSSYKKDIECTKTFNLKQPHPNLDKGEKEAIKKLFKREDIIITNADKEGVVFIVGTNNYIKKAEQQLTDKDNYHILPQDPTLGNNMIVNQAVDRFKKEKLITEKIADKLKTLDSRIPHFCIIPNIHEPGNPGDLVVISATAAQLKYLNTLTIIWNPL